MPCTLYIFLSIYNHGINLSPLDQSHHMHIAHTQTMGNCMAFQIPPRNKEAEAEFKASAPVQKINIKRYIVVRRKLQNDEEIHYLAPLLNSTPSDVGPNKDQQCGRRKVRIVMTLKQLELLLSGEKKKKKIQIRNNRVVRLKFNQSSRFQGRQKWHPSLPTIPEISMHNC